MLIICNGHSKIICNIAGVDYKETRTRWKVHELEKLIYKWWWRKPYTVFSEFRLPG